MISSRAELKARALEQLRGQWGKAVIVTLIMMVISIGISQIPEAGSLISLIISGPLALGAAGFYLDLQRGVNVRVEQMFDGFSRFVPALILHLLTAVFVLLWMLLLIVPGIIAALSYSMAFFILREQPQLTALEALSRSKEMMNGHKWRFFVLGLSFLGWVLLGVLTLGIGFLWINPYISSTTVQFYKELRDGGSPAA